jgi:hypothetical protein
VFEIAVVHGPVAQRVNKPQTRKMADDFVLNSILSAFLDDYHEIPSELDASALSQKEVEAQVNRMAARVAWR